MKIYQMTNDELTNGIKVLGEFYTSEGLDPTSETPFKSLVDEFGRRSKEFDEIETPPEPPKCGCGSIEFEQEGDSMACTGCGIVYNIGAS